MLEDAGSLEGGDSPVQIMTFNIRFENDRDGDNAWCFPQGLAGSK